MDERVTTSRPMRRAAAVASAVVMAAVVVGLVIARPAHAAAPAGAAGAAGARHPDRPTAVAGTPAAAAGARTAGRTAATPGAQRTALPTDCLPTPSGPPGSAYQLGVTGTIRGGKLRTTDAQVFDVSASFCGVVTVVAGSPPCAATGAVSSPSDGQVFGSMSATLSLVPGMTPQVPFVAHPGRISGGFDCGPSTNGLAVHLTAVVSASTGLFGLSCTVGPLTIPLSGVLTGPLDHANVTLTGSDFAVPAVAASQTCPGEAPADLDAIAGLPIAAGGASIVLPATVSLYRPAG